ncbi:MAG TPA: lysophospholipid acyltransferase family protein [Candidatus Sumerlaeota bacterium]|nr:lysophospholipid acyltransferase family protein [Candidatus Sumerlaeota bacterium]
MIFIFFRFLCRITARLLFRAQPLDLHNVPEKGGILIVSNHASFLDPPLTGIFIKRPVHFLAKSELFRIPLFGTLLRHINAHPIRREGVDREAIAMARDLLSSGNILVLFPEGTRTPDGNLQEIKTGMFLMVSGLENVPIVPAWIDGSFKALPRGALVPRPVKITVRYGKAYNLPQKGVEIARKDYYKTSAELVYKSILSLKKP